MATTQLQRLTPRIMSQAVPGTTTRWWERRWNRLLELRDQDGRSLIVKVERRYLGDLDAILQAVLDGALDPEAA